MKNLLIPLFVLLFGSLSAQDYQNIIKTQVGKITSQLKNLEIKSGDYNFCQQTKEFSDISQQLVVTENNFINIKTNGKNVSAEIEFYSYDEGDTTFFLLKSYNSHRFFGNELEFTFDYPDSSIVYIEDSIGNLLPFAKTITSYDGRLPIEKKSYIDFGILFEEDPIGLYQSNQENYNYKDDKLIYTTELQISLNTGLLEIGDSTYYTYDGDYLIEETRYNYIKDSLKYQPSSKTKYTYDNQGNPVSTEYSDYYGKWLLSNRSSATFDNKHREIFSLNETTYDNGETWRKSDRDSTIYDSPTLYLGFSNREVTEEWRGDDNWRIISVTTIKDCGSTPDNTLDIYSFDFNARFVGESIVFDNNKSGIENPVITLVDLQGRTILKNEYKNLPNTIRTSGLPEGIYILNIKSKESFGTKKLWKN